MPDTKTLKDALKDSLPDAIGDDAKAGEVVSAFYDALKEAVKGCDMVTLHGVGEFRVDPKGERRELIFTPDRVLLDTMNEGSVGVDSESNV